MKDLRVNLLLVLEKHFEEYRSLTEDDDDDYNAGRHNAYLEARNLCRTIRATLMNPAEETETP